MDTDLVFVVGFFVIVLAIPAIVSAFMDDRVPRAPALIILIGALMIAYAVRERPMTYSLDTVPDVILRVFADFTR
ncbi:hypothetical protein ACOI1H_05735 [Loktanella sp. DJP18]|uniref:hypothetical protein n=1 Tax=Loktanella sp. DJP18 TaxID=3409788 RepID=UPI003BB5666B